MYNTLYIVYNDHYYNVLYAYFPHILHILTCVNFLQYISQNLFGILIDVYILKTKSMRLKCILRQQFKKKLLGLFDIFLRLLINTNHNNHLFVNPTFVVSIV
jgi:hypothetical protein